MSVITSTVSKFIGVHITKSINKKRFLCEISEPSIASRVVKRKKTLQTQKHMYNYVSATTLRNYILDDPILDWFKYYGEENGFEKDVYNGSNKYSYFRFMLQRGIEYESYVMKNLLNAYGDYISFVSPIGSAFSLKSVEKTKYLMRTGSPIIYQANLINNRLNLFGVADLLVRQDYISKLFYINNDISTKETMAGPITRASTRADTNSYRYYVVDIKNSTVYEDSRRCILNNGSVRCYKSQVYLYNLMLGEMQGSCPDVGFILGRRFIDYSKNVFNGIYNLGYIDYEGRDKNVVDKTMKAIDWVQWVRSSEGGGKHNPRSDMNIIKEFEPNMKNYYDYPWHGAKEEIALKNNDITLLWSCGIKTRSVYKTFSGGSSSSPSSSFDVSKITKNRKRGRIIREIADTNIQNRVFNFGDIKLREPSMHNNVVMYVDFEFMNMGDVSFDFDIRQHIYMIGVGYMRGCVGGEVGGGEWVYKVFITDNLTERAEIDNMKRFIDYIFCVRDENCKDGIDLYHWSNVEKSLFNKRIRHNDIVYDNLKDIRWVDLLDIFRGSLITQKGVFNFGLKQVARKLKENNLIKTDWTHSSIDGMGSTVAIVSEYDYKNLSSYNLLKDIPSMKDIIIYNEIDCKVLAEIYELMLHPQKFKNQAF